MLEYRVASQTLTSYSVLQHELDGFSNILLWNKIPCVRIDRITLHKCDYSIEYECKNNFIIRFPPIPGDTQWNP